MIQTEMFCSRSALPATVSAFTVIEQFNTVATLLPDWFPPFDMTKRSLEAGKWSYATLEAESILLYARSDPAALSWGIAGLHHALHRFAELCKIRHRNEQEPK